MATRFTAYISKYALTKGVQECEVEDCFSVSPTMVVDREGPYRGYYHGNDWHRTREAAITRAEEMRTAKVASLEKQLARIRKLRFE